MTGVGDATISPPHTQLAWHSAPRAGDSFVIGSKLCQTHRLHKKTEPDVPQYTIRLPNKMTTHRTSGQNTSVITARHSTRYSMGLHARPMRNAGPPPSVHLPARLARRQSTSRVTRLTPAPTRNARTTAARSAGRRIAARGACARSRAIAAASCPPLDYCCCQRGRSTG